jgi:hypothetical protein
MIRRRGGFFAYRQQVAKTTVQRERSIGLSGHDPAGEWLKLSRSEREHFAQTVTTQAELQAWREERRLPIAER